LAQVILMPSEEGQQESNQAKEGNQDTGSVHCVVSGAATACA